MKKVVINNKFVSAKLTGVQRVGFELSERLIRRLEERGVQCTTLAPPKNLRFSKLRALWATLWEQLVLPIRARHSLIINLCNTAPVLALSRQFVLVHDAAVYDMPGNYSGKYRAFSKLIMSMIKWRGDRLGTVSYFSRSRIARALHIDEGSICVFQNGANHVIAPSDDDRILDRLDLRGKPYVLAVGSLQEGKNFKSLLLAMDQVTTGVRLVIVGGGDNVVFKSGVVLPSGRTILAGYVSDVELSALYRNAAVFAQPSVYEGFGLPALEAMALGAPIVCSNTASLPEVCGDAALYFNPFSPAEIAGCIDRVVSDNFLQIELKARGSEQVKKFNWDKSSEALADFICNEMLGLQPNERP